MKNIFDQNFEISFLFLFERMLVSQMAIEIRKATELCLANDASMRLLICAVAALFVFPQPRLGEILLVTQVTWKRFDSRVRLLVRCKFPRRIERTRAQVTRVTLATFVDALMLSQTGTIAESSVTLGARVELLTSVSPLMQS